MTPSQHWALGLTAAAITAGCAMPEYKTDPAVDCALLATNDQCDEAFCPDDPQCIPIEDRPVAVPMDESCWVPRVSNRGQIQGSWYGFADEKVVKIPEGFCPYRPGDAAMCLVGETIVDPTFEAWGAGVGLDLNFPEGGKGPEDKLPWNAAARKIVGFHVAVVGTVPQGLRVNFTTVAVATEAQPCFELPEVPGTYDVRFEQAIVPEDWDTETAGMTVDPSGIYSIEFQVIGGELGAPFDFCVTSLAPIWE